MLKQSADTNATINITKSSKYIVAESDVMAELETCKEKILFTDSIGF